MEEMDVTAIHAAMAFFAIPALVTAFTGNARNIKLHFSLFLETKRII